MITAGSGDEGYLNWVPGSPEPGQVAYPASSPHVVAVGGTRLEEAGGTWTSSIWNGDGIEHERGASGGGCSEHFEAPYWQRELPDWGAVDCEGRRALADIAAVGTLHRHGDLRLDAGAGGGLRPGWTTLGGTSLASPLIAAMFALAGGDRAAGARKSNTRRGRCMKTRPHARLGSRHRSGLQRLVPAAQKLDEEDGLETCTPSEEAAICSGHAICLAGLGYDGPSGLGHPERAGRLPGHGQSGEEAPAARLHLDGAERRQGGRYAVHGGGHQQLGPGGIVRVRDAVGVRCRSVHG